MTAFRYSNDGASQLRAVETCAIEMAAAEEGIEKGYAHLGWILLEVADMQFWRVHHDTWRDYVKSVAMKSRKTPAQLQRYMLTVRDLSDTFTAAQMELIGITKAMRLRAAKDYAIVLPPDVVLASLDPKITDRELKKVISTALKMPEEDGDYMDLEFEFMVTPEQRKFAEQVIDVAMHTDPLTKTNISKSAQMWDIFEKLGMEFLGSHSGDGN
jgi:hypothetical protein